MQISRLLEMIVIFLNRKNITAKELSEKFNVSIRTIYRDIDVLSSIGMPIYSERGKNGGYFIDAEFKFDKLLIENDEYREIQVALNILKSLGLLENNNLIDKLNVYSNSFDWIEVFPDNENFSMKNIFEKLKNSILSAKIIDFTNYNEYGQTHLVKVLPLKLIYTNKTWKLSAFNVNENRYSYYELNKIRDIAEIEDEIININKNTSEKNFILDKKIVTLKFSKRISYKKYDEFLNRDIKVNSDGSYEIDFEYEHINELYSFIIPFGGNVKIVSPEFIKHRVLEYTKSFLNNNL